MHERTRILLVSESAEFADFISGKIKEASESSVVYARDKAEAVHLIASESFHMVLFEVQSDSASAFEFLSELKKVNDSVPFVVLVESEREELAEQLLKQGAYDYILKNEVQFTRIAYLVQNILDRFMLALREKKLEGEVEKQKASLREIQKKLEAFSVHDELTGLFNHRYFQEKLSEEFLRSQRYNYPISCIMLDIDYFKALNEVRGHVVGDEVLRELSQVLMAFSRKADVVARYGGEEFAILLPHIDYTGATTFSERLRKEISDRVFLSNRFDLKITVSIGVSSFPEDSLSKYDDLILFADKALFRVKGEKGRNAVCCYSSIMKEMEAQIPALKFSEDKTSEFRKRLLDVSENAKRAYIESTKALVYALEAKDKFTLGHASRVAHYSVLIAKEMGLSEEEASTIEHAGLLHDVGKVCISDEVLLKQGPLTLEEYEKMKEHAVFGYQLIKSIKFLREEALIILHHHEWFNGQGYPNRLKGKEIPIGARIVAVLDAYDTMRVSGARYKKTLSCDETVKELIKQAGSQFDPEIVGAFVQVLVKRGEIVESSIDREKLKQAVESLKS